MGLFDFMKPKDKSSSASQSSGGNQMPSYRQHASPQPQPTGQPGQDRSAAAFSSGLEVPGQGLSQGSHSHESLWGGAGNGMDSIAGMPSGQDQYGQQQSDPFSGPYQQTGQQSYEQPFHERSASPPPHDQSSPYPQNLTHGSEQMSSKNQEIILSKLDAIRMAIQNIDHRLAALESRMGGQEIPSYHQTQQDSGTNNIF